MSIYNTGAFSGYVATNLKAGERAGYGVIINVALAIVANSKQADAAKSMTRKELMDGIKAEALKATGGAKKSSLDSWCLDGAKFAALYAGDIMALAETLPAKMAATGKNVPATPKDLFDACLVHFRSQFPKVDQLRAELTSPGRGKDDAAKARAIVRGLFGALNRMTDPVALATLGRLAAARGALLVANAAKDAAKTEKDMATTLKASQDARIVLAQCEAVVSDYAEPKTAAMAEGEAEADKVIAEAEAEAVAVAALLEAKNAAVMGAAMTQAEVLRAEAQEAEAEEQEIAA